MIWGHEAVPEDRGPYIKGIEEWIAFSQKVGLQFELFSQWSAMNWSWHRFMSIVKMTNQKVWKSRTEQCSFFFGLRWLNWPSLAWCCSILRPFDIRVIKSATASSYVWPHYKRRLRRSLAVAWIQFKFLKLKDEEQNGNHFWISRRAKTTTITTVIPYSRKLTCCTEIVMQFRELCCCERECCLP